MGIVDFRGDKELVLLVLADLFGTTPCQSSSRTHVLKFSARFDAAAKDTRLDEVSNVGSHKYSRTSKADSIASKDDIYRSVS